MLELCLEDANRICAAALAKAKTLKLSPMTVAVVDTAGCIKALWREDGSCQHLRPGIAISKARAAIMMGPKGSRHWQEDFVRRPNFVHALMGIADQSFLPGAGGVAVLTKDGTPLAGVGCTGDLADRDEEVAIAGIYAAGFIPNPECMVV